MLPALANTPYPALYDNMRKAIAACHRIDE